VPVRASSALCLVLAAIVGVAACSGDEDAAPASTGPTATTAPVVTATDTTVVATPAEGSLFPTGDVDTGLQPWIELASGQLAAALGAAPADVAVVSAVLVVWPDAALGCPEPDQQYAAVLTDGAVIELAADGDVYRFHAGGERGPFLCARPITTAPPRG
jgi:hypothetical protein